MILKAIDDGVSEAPLAKALNVSVKTIRDSRSRLTDIAAKTLEHLKDEPISELALRMFKKAKAFRQIEMAELMVMSNTYTAPYASALLAATPPEQLVAPPKGRKARTARQKRE